MDEKELLTVWLADKVLDVLENEDDVKSDAIRYVQKVIKSVYHGNGEFDMFLSLLVTLKPTAESLDSCLIPAPFWFTGDGSRVPLFALLIVP